MVQELWDIQRTDGTGTKGHPAYRWYRMIQELRDIQPTDGTGYGTFYGPLTRL